MRPPSFQSRKADDRPRSWYVRLQDGEVRGPYHITHLEDLLFYGNLPPDFEISNLEKQEWMPVSDHPLGLILFKERDALRLGNKRIERIDDADRNPIEARAILQENRRHEAQHEHCHPSGFWRLPQLIVKVVGQLLSLGLLLGWGLLLAYLLVPEPDLAHYLIGGFISVVVGLYLRRTWRQNSY